MRKDVKQILIFSAFTSIATIVSALFLVSEQIEKQNRGFTISHEETTPSAAGVLTLLFAIATVIGFVIAFVFYSEDKEYDKLMEDS